jgi:hypothetical protein
VPVNGLGDVERLRQEALDLARALHRHLSSSESSSMPRIAMMSWSSLVALQDLLDPVGRREVLLAEDVRLEDRRRRVERVDRGVDALLGDRRGEHRRGVEVGEHRRGRRVGEVVAGT